MIGPLINDEYGDVTFTLYALKAKGQPHRLLVREAEKLRQRLLHVEGVKKVQIVGERPERIFVELSYPKLATLGIPPTAVFEALNNRNLLTRPARSIPRDRRSSSGSTGPSMISKPSATRRSVPMAAACGCPIWPR